MPFLLAAVRRRPLLLRSRAPTVRAFRIAATVLFVVDGAVFGSWAARIPDVAAQVGAGPATLGLALLCISLGALAGMQLTGALCRRLGPGLVASGAAVLTGCTLTLPGLSTSVGELAVTLLVFGLATGVLNVAMNAVGVRVEAAAQRPVLPSLHAGVSFGGLGGAAAAGLVAATTSIAAHLLVVAAVGILATAAAAPILLAADAEPVREHPGAAPGGSGGTLVVLLGLIAGCTAFGEGAVTDWGALHLDEIGASPALAAAGFAAFSVAMAFGRLAGNALLRTLGPTNVVTGGALLATAGAAAVAIVPVVAVGLAGFVLMGLGLANVFPVAIARAGAHAGPAGVARASSIGYTGLLGAPPLLGIVAEAVGLSVAFAAVAVLAAVAAGVAALVRPRSAPRPATAEGLLRQALHATAPGFRLVGTAIRRHCDSLDVLHAQFAHPPTGRPTHHGLEAVPA
ncbi:MFS transporter [Pseudonocardia sp. MH-G8]|uniref:MFS transporter n=1 Tax=Pseudonocardia sp. MH-G8 TaxID=1854588 RepID=UPI0018E95EDE|nr:MFS transporter [Pseudonocardia sp. MH-G8]